MSDAESAIGAKLQKMLFDELARTSAAVRSTPKRNAKVALLADVLRRAEREEIEATVAFLVGTTPLGRIGVGWATLSEVSASPAELATLTVLDVDRSLRSIEALSGSGVQAARRSELARLLSDATDDEQRLIRGILSGELRQGALDGVLAAAVANAADVPVAAIRRASMMAGDLGVAARTALVGGRVALDAIDLQALRPVQPMLASSAPGVADAMVAIAGVAADAADAAGGGLAQVDWKLDGVRVQAHRRDGEVRLYTRNLNDVTPRLPGVVELVSAMPGGDLVLDGEAMGIMDDGSPQPFQDSMRVATSLDAFFFDVLLADGEPVHAEPLSVRREVLASAVPTPARLPSIVTADVAEAEAFLGTAIGAGHEGVMVKDLTQPYEAGRRGKGWRKVKPVYTFDLVVLAVEWGSGRRRGLLSNIHLGARDPKASGFVMVGKTFKGMTDEMLRWQTERFGQLTLGEGPIGGRHAVHLAPEQVVEIAVDGVQASTTYPGGVALRFARVKRYRHDKMAAEADTIDALRSLLRPRG